jgi:hypothetical protein
MEKGHRSVPDTDVITPNLEHGDTNGIRHAWEKMSTIKDKLESVPHDIQMPLLLNVAIGSPLNCTGRPASSQYSWRQHASLYLEIFVMRYSWLLSSASKQVKPFFP